MLSLTVNRNGKVFIGDDIVVEVVEIRRDRVKLAFTAPREVDIDREKVRRSKRGTTDTIPVATIALAQR
jgi:carbon storage regulator CsrA